MGWSRQQGRKSMVGRQRIINHFLNPYFDFAEFGFIWLGLRSFESSWLDSPFSPTNPQKMQNIKEDTPKKFVFLHPIGSVHLHVFDFYVFSCIGRYIYIYIHIWISYIDPNIIYISLFTYHHHVWICRYILILHTHWKMSTKTYHKSEIYISRRFRYIYWDVFGT